MLVVLQGTERGYKQQVKQLEFSRDGSQLYAGITKQHRRNSDLAEVCRLDLSTTTHAWDVLNTDELYHGIAFTELKQFPKSYGVHQLLAINGRSKYGFDKAGEMVWFHHDGQSAAGSHAAFLRDERSLVEFRYNLRDSPLVKFDFRGETPAATEITISDPSWFHHINHARLFPCSIAAHENWLVLGTYDWLVVGWVKDSRFHPTNAYHRSGEFRWSSFSLDGSSVLGICGWQIFAWDHVVPDRHEDPVQDEKSSVNLRGHQQLVTDAAFLPDGRLMTSSLDSTVRIWDIETGEQLECYDWKIGPVSSVAVSPDGAIAAAGGSGENQIVLWDLD